MKKIHKIVGGAVVALLLTGAAPAFANGSYSFSFGYSSGGHYGYGHHGGRYSHYQPYRHHHGWSGGYTYYAPRYYCPPPVSYRYYAPPPAPRYYAEPPTYYYEGGSFYRY